MPRPQSYAPPGAKFSLGLFQFDTWLSIVLLAGVMFLPAGLCYLFTGTSHSAGTTAAGVLIILALAWRAPAIDAFLPLFVIVVLLSIHLAFAIMLTSDQSNRAMLSLGLFSLVFFSSYTLGKWFFLRPSLIVDQATTFLRLTMIVIAVASIAGLQPPGINPWEKPVFPFTEPSHYALIFTPLLLDASIKSNNWRRYAWIMLGFVLAYFLKNLSLAVGVTMVALVTLPLLQLILAALVAPMVLLSVNLTYFTDRLDFGDGITNLSTLVYIQGWELVADSMHRSAGWGIGFQQLGYGPIRSTASKIIFQLTQLDLNLQDGGFVAAKLISELGVFGMALTIGFVVIAIKAALILRGVGHGLIRPLSGRDYALCIIVGYSIDMFVRGVAYFTASSMLFLAALIYYVKFKKAHEAIAFQ